MGITDMKAKYHSVLYSWLVGSFQMALLLRVVFVATSTAKDFLNPRDRPRNGKVVELGGSVGRRGGRCIVGVAHRVEHI